MIARKLTIAAALLVVAVIGQQAAAEINVTGRAGNPLQVRVYEAGSFQGGRADWISGARVSVRPRQGSVPGHLINPKYTNRGGSATFGVDRMWVTIRVSKPGYRSVTRNYLMPAYGTTVNIAMTKFKSRGPRKTRIIPGDRDRLKKFRDRWLRRR